MYYITSGDFFNKNLYNRTFFKKNINKIIVIFGNFANDFCLATNFAAIARFSI